MKIKIISLILTFSMVLFSGCSKDDQTEIKDREGNVVTSPDKVERIISTAPSNTEIIMELGLGDKLVAVDTYSLEVEGVDKDIESIDFATPNAEVMIGLEPDIIIASGHNKSGSAQDPFKVISDSGIPVVYIPSAVSIEDIYKDIEFISGVLNESKKGSEIIENTKSKINEIKSTSDTITNKKNVYFDMEAGPNLYSFGSETFLNEMIEIAGGKNIFADENSWLTPSAEVVIDKNPDVIFTNVNYIEDPIKDIKSREGFENINAVKNNDIYQIDTNSSSRPTHNIVKAIEEMASSMYPELYEK